MKDRALNMLGSMRRLQEGTLRIDKHESDVEVAKQWLVAHLGRINDGGSWGVPRSGSIYRVDHKNKTLTLTAGCGDRSTESLLPAIGWKLSLGRVTDTGEGTGRTQPGT